MISNTKKSEKNWKKNADKAHRLFYMKISYSNLWNYLMLKYDTDSSCFGTSCLCTSICTIHSFSPFALCCVYSVLSYREKTSRINTNSYKWKGQRKKKRQLWIDKFLYTYMSILKAHRFFLLRFSHISNID